MAHYNNDLVYRGFFGLAIGDALGVPVEFLGRNWLKKNPVRDFQAFGTHQVPAGTWSDDTSMTLALAWSLIEKHCFDYDNIMQRFCDWLYHDDYTATEKTFDVGCTCAAAIGNYARNGDPRSCGESGERSNGNGSLMRILPVAYVSYANQLSDVDRYRLTRDNSALTHAHEISILGCYIYVTFVCSLLNGRSKNEAYADIKKAQYSMFSEETIAKYHRILKGNIASLDESEIASSGYVLNSLEAALWCLMTSDNYEDAVLKAVNLGKDTDTVGAITGSMAGICYGIPQVWAKKLQNAAYLKDTCKRFAAAQIAPSYLD